MKNTHKCVEFPSSCLKYSIVLLNPSCSGTQNEKEKQDNYCLWQLSIGLEKALRLVKAAPNILHGSIRKYRNNSQTYYLNQFTEFEWLLRVSFLALLGYSRCQSVLFSFVLSMVVKQVGPTYRRDATEAEHCVFFWGAGEGNMPCYLSDDDASSLAVDVEGQMARLATKTLRVHSRLVVLTYCNQGQRVLLLSLER